MADTVKINSIDQTQIADGYVIVDTTVTVSGTAYDQVYTANATDPIGVATSVQSQAEQYRQQILTAPTGAASAVDLTSLIGDVINL